MPPFTRRRALQGAVGLLAGLAGCNDLVAGPESGPNDRPTPTPAADRPSGDESVREPATAVLRSTEYDPSEPIARFARDREAIPTDGGTVPTDERVSGGLIADRATAETFAVDESAVADSEVSDSPATVREFVAATDFDTETILVDTWPVGECYRLKLCYVRWGDGEVESRYGRFLREFDVRCEADARDTQVTLARLPVALDPDAVEIGGTGVSGGECFPLAGERGMPTPRPKGATDTGTAAGAETGTPADDRAGTAGEGGDR